MNFSSDTDAPTANETAAIDFGVDETSPHARGELTAPNVASVLSLYYTHLSLSTLCTQPPGRTNSRNSWSAMNRNGNTEASKDKTRQKKHSNVLQKLAILRQRLAKLRSSFVSKREVLSRLCSQELPITQITTSGELVSKHTNWFRSNTFSDCCLVASFAWILTIQCEFSSARVSTRYTDHTPYAVLTILTIQY
jgi:hypothetical protein